MSSEDLRQHAPVKSRPHPQKGVHPFPGQEFWTLDQWRTELTTVIREAEAAGATDFEGGVPMREIISRVPRSRNATVDAVLRLVETDEILRVSGTCPTTGRARYSYRLAEDASGTDDDDDDKYQSPWAGREISRRSWAAEHGIFPDFLPFAYVSPSPFEHLKKITAYLESRPDHCQSVSRETIRNQLDLPQNHVAANLYHIETAMLLHGWWRRDNISKTGFYFANPNYCHGHSDEWLITDTEERVAYVKKCLWYGLGTERAAVACGISARSIRRTYAPKIEFDRPEDGDVATWQEFSEEGRRRRDRTYHTLRMWGFSQREVAEAFGIGRATVNRARKRTQDFEPPTDPTFDIDANTRPGGRSR